MKSALKKSPIPKSRAYIAKLLNEPVFDPHWHFHSEYQIFLVIKGNGTRFIGDSIRPFKTGDVTLIGPNLPHLWRSDQETEQAKNIAWSQGAVIYFKENFLGNDFLNTQEAIKLQRVFRKSPKGMEFTGSTAKKLKKMVLKLILLDGLDGILQLLRILKCMSHAQEYNILASEGYTNTLRETDTERMYKVYSHIMKNFKSKITVTELAKITNMTPTSFSRYFKLHANKSFTQFLSEVRIGHACKLLIDEGKNVSTACYESGFQTLSNFNKQFKSITKRTPLAYKKEYGP